MSPSVLVNYVGNYTEFWNRNKQISGRQPIIDCGIQNHSENNVKTMEKEIQLINGTGDLVKLVEKNDRILPVIH